MKLFSKNRKQLVNTSGLRKYLLYAIGEVILVVIGILIALTINNHNEERKQANNLNNILKIFRNDIVQDTIKSDYVIKYYKTQDSIGRIAMSDTVSESFYVKNTTLHNVIFTSYPLSITTKGHNLLKEYSYDVEIAQDSVVVYGLALYDQVSTWFTDLNTKLEKDVYENTLNMKENYNFAADLYMKRKNVKAVKYYQSDDFHNRLALNLQLKSKGAITLLQSFNAASKELINRIDKRLDN